MIILVRATAFLLDPVGLRFRAVAAPEFHFSPSPPNTFLLRGFSPQSLIPFRFPGFDFYREDFGSLVFECGVSTCRFALPLGGTECFLLVFFSRGGRTYQVNCPNGPGSGQVFLGLCVGDFLLRFFFSKAGRFFFFFFFFLRLFPSPTLLLIAVLQSREPVGGPPPLLNADSTNRRFFFFSHRLGIRYRAPRLLFFPLFLCETFILLLTEVCLAGFCRPRTWVPRFAPPFRPLLAHSFFGRLGFPQQFQKTPTTPPFQTVWSLGVGFFSTSCSGCGLLPFL